MTNISHSVRLGRAENLQTALGKGTTRIYNLGQRAQEGNSRNPAVTPDVGKRVKVPQALTKRV